MCLHLNHPAGDQVGPHEPAGDHLHKLDVPLLDPLSLFCRLLRRLSVVGLRSPWSLSRDPPPPGPRAPQSLCLPRSPKSGAHLWVQHVQTGVAAAAVLLTSFVRPPVTARPPTLPGIGCRSRRRGKPGVKIKAARDEHKAKPHKSHIFTSVILGCLK